MSNRWSSIKLQVLGFDPRQRFPAKIPPWQRAVYGAFGLVSRNVPVLVVYGRPGHRRRAERMRDRLKRYGYADVRIRRERKVKDERGGG